MTFTADYKGYKVLARIGYSGTTFSCEQITDKDGSRKDFKTEKDIEVAIDRFDLAQRKNFSNTSAVYLYHDRAEEVEVKSVTGDGEAWVIRSAGYRKDSREKVAMRRLFTDKAAVELFVAAAAIMEAAERRVDAMRRELVNWQPEFQS